MDSDYRKRLAAEIRENPFMPLSEAIYFILLQDIVSYKYLPGDKLKEAKLAKSFGVSRTPVRSALHMLISRRILDKKENGAAVVLAYTPQEWADLQEIRLRLEPHAASQAAVRMTDEEMACLEKEMGRLEEACRARDLEASYALEELFHELIIRGSHNTFLIAEYEALKLHIQRSRLQYTAKGGFYDLYIEEHSLILAAMQLRDPIMAHAAMKRHLVLLASDRRLQNPANFSGLLHAISANVHDKKNK